LGETTARDRTSRAYELVFAIAHEVGNHLGALRLQAHLLDEDLDPHALALASVEIDGLAGRAGPLLALLRPLLSRESRALHGGAPWSSILAGIAQHYEDQGTRGVSLAVGAKEVPDDSDPTAPKLDWLHPLLLVLLDATLALVPTRGTIRIGLKETRGKVSLMIDDDGPEEDLSAGVALRGRPLAVALARELLVLVGGRVTTRRDAAGTRVELIFPAMS